MLSIQSICGDAILGVYAKERSHQQRYQCSIEAKLRTYQGRSYADYAKITGVVRFVIENGYFLTIEDCLDCFEWFFRLSTIPDFRLLSWLELELGKPEALSKGAVPSIQRSIHCSINPCSSPSEQIHFEQCSFSLFYLEASRSYTLEHFQNQVILILEGQVLWGENSFSAGEALFSREQAPEKIQSQGKSPAFLLMIHYQENVRLAADLPSEQYF